MNSVAVLFLAFVGLSALCWYISKDDVYCNVKGAGYKPINGYYAALGGIYLKRGRNIFFFPDFFDAVALRRDRSSGASIGLRTGKWTIWTRDVAYMNSPKHPEDYIYLPPNTGWNSSQRYTPSPEVFNCKGTLDESPSPPSNQRSNLELLIGRPVTTLLLAGIFYYAYHLWANRVEVSTVSYIYDAVVNGGEYWRIVTSSFAHFDLWHIMFNTMTLYQMADLEDVYGSVQFAYLNADLVIITMAICTWIYHIQITRYGREDLRIQQSVGYSCVLFALMVDASVRMSEFCPLFFLPRLCFKTMFIPNPFFVFGVGSKMGLPVNFGPLILLVVTKIIIPRSSFTGHLAGIVIGYPLAWNMISWLTPPLAIPLTVLAVIYKDQLYVWKISGYDYSVASLSEFVPANQLRRYYVLWAAFIFLILCIVPTVAFVGPMQLIPRGTFLFLAWSALQSRRIEWLTDARTTHDSCITLMVIAAWAAISIALYDVMSLSGSLSSGDLLRGCALTDSAVMAGASLFAINLALELIFFGALIACLQDVKIAEPYLQKWRLSAANVQRDVEVLGLADCCGLLKNRFAFSGPARTLQLRSGDNNPRLGDYSSVPPGAEGEAGILVEEDIEGLDEDGDSLSERRRIALARANNFSRPTTAIGTNTNTNANGGTSTGAGRINPAQPNSELGFTWRDSLKERTGGAATNTNTNTSVYRAGTSSGASHNSSTAGGERLPSQSPSDAATAAVGTNRPGYYVTPPQETSGGLRDSGSPNQLRGRLSPHGNGSGSGSSSSNSSGSAAAKKTNGSGRTVTTI